MSQLPPPANPQPPPPNPFGNIGAGEHWIPAPGGWTWTTLNSPTGPIYVLRITTAGGTMALALTREDITRLITQAQELTTGLTIAPGPILG